MSEFTVVDEAFRFVEANPTLLERLYKTKEPQQPRLDTPTGTQDGSHEGHKG